MERLKWRMEAEWRAAELEAMAHDRLMKERSAEVARAMKCRGMPATVTPIAPEMSPPITRGGGLPSTPLPLPHHAAATPGATGKFATSTNFVLNSFHCISTNFVMNLFHCIVVGIAAPSIFGVFGFRVIRI